MFSRTVVVPSSGENVELRTILLMCRKHHNIMVVQNVQMCVKSYGTKLLWSSVPKPTHYLNKRILKTTDTPMPDGVLEPPAGAATQSTTRRLILDHTAILARPVVLLSYALSYCFCFSITVRGCIGFHSRTPLVRTACPLSRQRHISEVFEPADGPH